MAKKMSRATRTAARREDILRVAVALFRQRGFTAVSVDDIGSAVGVSGPAMYRHFSGKQDLLAEVVLTFLSRMEAAQHGVPEAERLDVSLKVILDNPDALAVMLRQLRYLDEPGLDRIREACDRISEHSRLGDLVAGGASEHHLRLRALAGALVSVGLVHPMSSTLKLTLARQMHTNVHSVPLPAAPQVEPEVDAAAPTSLLPASRREAILANATKLFRQDSFHGVSLRDIGDSVGVTASAIRRHFNSKDDLLAALFNRGGEHVAAAIAGVLESSTTPSEAIEGIIRNYAGLALQRRDLIYIYVTETQSLPAPLREERRARQRGHVNEMASLQQQVAPDISREEAWACAAASFALINEVVMNDDLVTRPGLEQELVALALSLTALVTTDQA